VLFWVKMNIRSSLLNAFSSVENARVAIVHDWLTSMRGGEKVVEALCGIFPESDIFTLLLEPGKIPTILESHTINTSFINRLPFKSSGFRYYLPLFPTAIELFDFKGYDLVISSSHCVAKGVITPPDVLHIAYIHTPMRYVWDMYFEYFGRHRIGAFSGMVIPFFANYLRMWDVASSHRVDWFVANSRHVSHRIRKYYNRESAIIHPPVNTGFYQPGKEQEDYFLIVSALVPYKKVDLAIRVFNRLKKPLLVIGNGPEEKSLKALAGSTVRFMDFQEPAQLLSYYQNCLGLIFPGEEDFGIVPVEAQACGRPVIAFARGGALETVIGYDGSNEKKCTGVFFDVQNQEELEKAVLASLKLRWDFDFICEHAGQFGVKRFNSEMKKFVAEKLIESQSR